MELKQPTYANITSNKPLDGLSYLQAHDILGHQSNAILKKTSQAVDGFHLSEEKSRPQCASCLEANSTSKPHPKHRSSQKSEIIGELTYSDIHCANQNRPTMHGERYNVKYMDDCTKFTGTYLLKDKNAHSVYDAYKKYIQTLKRVYKDRKFGAFNRISQVVRTDNDGAYMKELADYFHQNDIHHQTIAPYDHQQLGAMERVHRSISNIDRAQRVHANAPIELWGYSILHATELKNMSWQSGTHSELSASELFTGIKPNLQTLKPWGTRAILNVPREIRPTHANHGIRLYVSRGITTSQSFNFY